jgi:hypothetical protein
MQLMPDEQQAAFSDIPLRRLNALSQKYPAESLNPLHPIGRYTN